MVEAKRSELWESDDQLSEEDQEEAIDPKEDEPMQEQESRNFCNSMYTRTSYEFGSESETWEEFEAWKEEEERREYESWCEGRKTYEEFGRWATHEEWGGSEWDDREERAGDDENDYDDWSLFEEWQENEQRRKFSWLMEQEKHWIETDWEGVRYNTVFLLAYGKHRSDKVVIVGLASCLHLTSVLNVPPLQSQKMSLPTLASLTHYVNSCSSC